jgi:hypothetical protein
LPACELGVGHDVELIQTGKVFDFVLCLVRGDEAKKRFDRQRSHDLREHELTLMHSNPWQSKAAKDALVQKNDSNRGQTKMLN